MKVVISHDVDHLSVKEHFGDLVLPKFIGVCKIELLKRCIPFGTFRRRISGLWREKAWNNLEELLEFDKEHGVKSTFFVAVSNGLGISYTLDQAKRAIALIVKAGFDAGVHGIAYQDPSEIREEYNRFKEMTGKEEFGIRMHYLRRSEDTPRYLEEAGYSYDTTVLSEEELRQPYFEGGLLEFPIHLEDMRLFSPFHRGLSLEEAIRCSEEIFERIEDGILNVLLHPRYFSDEFPRYKKWYEWLISHIEENDVEFVGYEELRKELAESAD